MRKFVCFLFIWGSLLLTAPTVSAEEKLVTANEPEAILNLAKGFGRAELTKDGQGDPRIEGKIDGLGYNIFFYGCTNGLNCESIQFETGWGQSVKGVSLTEINAWNSRRLFVMAHLNKDGLVRLRMEIILRFGMTEKNLDAYFDIWKLLTSQFQKEVISQSAK